MVDVSGKVFVVTSLGDRWCEYLPLDDVPISRHAHATMTRVLELFLGDLAWSGKLGFGPSFVGLQQNLGRAFLASSILGDVKLDKS